MDRCSALALALASSWTPNPNPQLEPGTWNLEPER